MVFERFYFRPDVGDGIDIFNLFDIRNGDPVGQFKAVEPFDIRLIEPISEEKVLVVADFHGTVLWDTAEKYVYEWGLKADPPEFICPGPAGRAVLVSSDGGLIRLLDTDNGTIARSIQPPGKVVGRPVFDGSRYLVPISGGIIALNGELQTTALYAISGGLKEASLIISGGFIYIRDPDRIMKLMLD